MKFIKSVFVVSFFTFLTRISGFIRDVFFAKYLGNGPMADAFFVAFRLPNYFRKIFAEGAFNSSFTPIFASFLDKKGTEKSIVFARNIFSLLLYVLLIFTLVIQIGMPFVMYVMAPGFVGNVNQFIYATKMSHITFFYLTFISLASMLGAILNSMDKFAAASASPIILNATFVVFMVVFNKYNMGFVLSWAVFVSGILQFAFLYYFTAKEKVALYPVLPTLDLRTKHFLGKFFHGIIGSSIVQLSGMVDSIMATLAGAGAVSYLYYADRISQFPLALIGTAIGIGILPLMSRTVASGNREKVYELEEDVLFISCLLGLPAAVGIFLLAYPIVSVLFERGQFTSADTIMVGRALKAYACSLPLFIFAKVFQTIFYAKKDTKTPMIISLCCLVVSVTLNLIFMRRWGYLGLAISTFPAFVVNVGMMVWILGHNGDLKIGDSGKKRLAKVALSAAFMGVCLVVFDYFVGHYLNLSRTIRLILTIGFGGASYFAVSHFLGVLDLNELKHMLLNKK